MLEWEFVIILGCSEGIIPSKMTFNDIASNYDNKLTGKDAENTPEFEQELNCMYVGQTRAKRFLMLTHYNLDTTTFRREGGPMRRSRFIDRHLGTIKENGGLSLLKKDQ